MIPRETVDRILDATQIVDVVGDFVTLKRRGANYTACCPFHNEKTPSFSVSPSKGIYKCFGCGKSGTAVGFLMEHESLSYVEALKYLARKYHIEVVEKEETAEEIAARQKNESLMLVTEFAQNFFVRELDTPDGKALGRAYFKSRGLSDETVRKFGLGWAPRTRDGLSRAEREAGYKEEFLVETGLSIRKDDGSLADRFYERVMFPIHSVSGRVIAFGGRTLRNDKTLAKYVNSPESEIYNKSRSLYGIYFAKSEISRQDKCLLVEGYLDVISMHQLGITNVVASSGTSLTVEQVRLIHKFTENVTIIYDGDSAGIHAAIRGIGLVLKEGLNVRVVLLPDGDDPDSFSRKHTLEEVTGFIAEHERDFVSFKTDLLLSEAGSDPLKKANLINDIADTIALVPDAVKRAMYVETCSEKFHIAQETLFQRINSTRRSMLAQDRTREERQREREAVRSLEESRQPQEAPLRETGTPGWAGPLRETGTSGWAGPLRETGTSADAVLAPCEKELLEFILNNGQDLLNFDVDSEHYTEEKVNVAEFIDNSLQMDGEVFVNEPYRVAYDTYYRYYDDGLPQEQIVRKMIDGEDRQTAVLVSDLVIPRYDISVQNYSDSMTAESTRIVIYVPRAVIIYKIRRIDTRLAECSGRLGSVPPDDEAAIKDIMQEMRSLQQNKNMLNEKLGRRFMHR